METRAPVFFTILVLMILSISTSSCSDSTEPEPPKEDPVPDGFTYQVVNSFPHADTAWTQGFEYDNGNFLIGTGMVEHSHVWKSDVATGNILSQASIPKPYFGEGVTRLGSRIYQLTWLYGLCFVYDEADFNAPTPPFGTAQGITPADTLEYNGEGWGLTNDGTEIIMSNGSSLIRIRDPDDFSIIRDYRVYDRDRFVNELNELELINGMVYANVLPTDSVCVFDPADGRVTAWIDLTGLPLQGDANPNQDALNGIAYDAVGDRLFVTGKYWSKIYEIELVPVTNP